VNKKFAQTQLSFGGTQHRANIPTELKELPYNNFKKIYKLLFTKKILNFWKLKSKLHRDHSINDQNMLNHH